MASLKFSPKSPVSKFTPWLSIPQDRVYAAVLPDAKIYRIDKTGKPQLFFDPKCKYVWAMAFDHSGNLFVATGDSGLIYRVTPDGKGSKFFDTEETHARSHDHR